MKIALDGMGGDFAPQEIVKGAVESLKEFGDFEVIITGDEHTIGEELKKYGSPSRISILPTDEVITMHDHPRDALLKKKNSSLYRAIRLVKDGEASGIISAGNTGAQMAISIFVLGRLPGVSRPAIGVPIPYRDSQGLLVDGGASVDVTAREYVMFALLGKIYLESILGRSVTIGLLNIGEEPEKGPRMLQEVYKMLSERFKEFKGNVEANDALTHKVDVIVADGFSGNMLLKAVEGAAEAVIDAIKETAHSNFKAKIGGQLMRSSLRKTLQRFDFETFGGSPLLGINGISIIAHGRSRHTAIKNAVRKCYTIDKERVIEKMKEQFTDELFRDTENSSGKN
jgi:glycerol-3-phosphate acyltransferase PlsX